MSHPCPCCIGTMETMDHLFEGCSEQPQEDTRGACDADASEVLAKSIQGTRAAAECGDTESLSRVICDLIRGTGGYRCLPIKLEQCLLQIHSCSSWYKYAGIVHSSVYKFVYGCWVHEIDLKREVCTRSLGAKMGIGKNMKCKCSRCAALYAATDAYNFAAQESIQTHGGIGFTWEADTQFFYRRSQVLGLALGSSITWKNKLVNQLEEKNIS